MTEDLSNIFAEFMDDYYAECDEHLVALRNDLLAMEDACKAGEPLPGPALEDAYRRLHTLKGLSGMVGVGTAERVAHAMEDIVRALRDHRLAPTSEAIDGLFDGVKMLEQILAAHRADASPPEIEGLLGQLEALLPSIATVRSLEESAPLRGLFEAEATEEAVLLDDAPGLLSEVEPEGAEMQTPPGAGEEHLWRFTFTPSAALAQQGYNVDWVRQQLLQMGTLERAVPLIAAEGQIQFEFLLRTTMPPAAFAPLAEAGVTWTAVEESQPSSSPSMPAPSEAPPKPEGASGVSRAAAPSLLRPSSVVRVELGRLDELMQIVGEMVITRSRLEEHLERVMGILPRTAQRELEEINDTLGRHLRNLRERIMRVRMVPVGEIFDRMRFVVRDLERELGKPVDLVVEGQETEVDKLLVERMMDPLLHLVRNALSHGIEDAETRRALGKPERGQVVLRAATEGDLVRIEVEDDGRGIDLQAVTARAREVGLLGPDETVAPDTVMDILCAPGFSTRTESDLASGRGVGLSVVRDTVADLGGHLDLTWEEGRGTRFVIQLPLTLAILDALLVSVGGEAFAVPLSAVREVMEIDAEALTELCGGVILPYRGQALSVTFLGEVFGLGRPAGRALHVLVVNTGRQIYGLVVDRILGQREIVVRALEDPLVAVRGIAGATDLGDGRAVLILDVASLVNGRIYEREGAVLRSV